MKIGILTFHWATNYGAVLQTYALQTFLESKGHEVVIINYKPRNYDNNFWTYIRNRKFLKHSLYKNELKKEAALSEFRRLHLHLTDRITKSANLSAVCKGFDCIISGSDQVLNPSFLLNGEGQTFHHQLTSWIFIFLVPKLVMLLVLAVQNIRKKHFL